LRLEPLTRESIIGPTGKAKQFAQELKKHTKEKKKKKNKGSEEK